MRGMVIDMDDEQLRTLVDVQGFLDGTVAMEFAVASEERYAFIARTVKRFGYGRLSPILFRYITFEELDRIVDSVDRLVFGD